MCRLQLVETGPARRIPSRLRPRAHRGRVTSQRVRADDLPVVAIADFLALVVAHRPGVLFEILDVAAGGGRGVHEQDAAGFGPRALPRIRDVAREERAGAGTADAHLVADHERDLSRE